ncbi:predicted protein [Histoplasma mississippiense (nom. inval.)]|uniref:predicted protein n=1 Tax=Ajellomyces capsulatus (strain NAm1 / WU24) TaxID=2059318 RepID=UPI000157D478|nr:predicted protein [Histoplasma mississippiense (nom. inval.)]EDN07508.1 predicted protein [Histoplasma mississippiense (nom. inval.)]
MALEAMRSFGHVKRTSTSDFCLADSHGKIHYALNIDLSNKLLWAPLELKVNKFIKGQMFVQALLYNLLHLHPNKPIQPIQLVPREKRESVI